PRVLGIDGDEELDDLTRVEPIEENGRHLDAEVLSRLGDRVEGEEPVLAIEHPEHAMLLGDLQETQVVLARHRREGETLLGGADDRARNGGQGASVLALSVMAAQLVELVGDDTTRLVSLVFS